MSDTCTHLDTAVDVTPSGDGCVECLETGGRWVHLRMCMSCGHIGCCDSSPGRHATAHFHGHPDHPLVRSFEPGEDWFYDYRSGATFNGPTLRAPHMHPLDQPVPGPAGQVPRNWMDLLND